MNPRSAVANVERRGHKFVRSFLWQLGDEYDIPEFLTRPVKLNYPEGHRVRAVTHRMVEAEDIDLALDRILGVVQEFPAGLS